MGHYQIRHEQRFQSTLPCGSDCKVTRLLYYISISIHAPLRERLSHLSLTLLHQSISIHAPLRERRARTCRPFLMFHVFQSTLPCGSDNVRADLTYQQGLFQSTLPCGSDSFHNITSYLPKRFQSTLPCGSDVLRLCRLIII